MHESLMEPPDIETGLRPQLPGYPTRSKPGVFNFDAHQQARICMNWKGQDFRSGLGVEGWERKVGSSLAGHHPAGLESDP